MNNTPAIIAALLEQVRDAPLAELPKIIGEVQRVHAEALTRIMTAGQPPMDDELVDADEAADMLGKKSRWVRDHAHKLPRVEMVGRTLRFSKRKLQDMIAKGRLHG